MSPQAYKDGQLDRKSEIERAMVNRDWICDREKMALTNDAFFIHPMPVDRGHEVTDEIASGPRSIIYEVAENRLHAQKAIMALTMGEI
jgi:N-acetylornithine carbamoyltransferase